MFRLRNILSTILLILQALVTAVHAQVITSFTPVSGPIGTTVIINGSGFNTSPASNIVFFGATMAPVTAASATTLTVRVPTGANYVYITVTNLGTNLTAYSLRPFNVTTVCSSSASFAPAVTVQGGSHNVESCDIDADGKPDLVIPDYFNNTFTVTRNLSVPGFISFAPKVAFPWAAGGQPCEIAIGDLDGDGKPDVALGGNGWTYISVYRNTSTAGSISFAPRLDFPASSGQGQGVKIIDIDLDGKPDIASVHWSGNCLWVLRNTSIGPGSISFAPGVSFGTTSQPHKLDVGDLDGDGKPDMIITAFTSNMLSIFRNTSVSGTISFAARQDYTPGTVPYFVHVGDIDVDGKADIAVVNRDVATLAVYRNLSVPGSITLGARQTFATPAGTMTHYGLAFGDLDGDNKPDIAIGNYTLNITSIFMNTSVPGTISFATRTDLSSGVAYDVIIDDFDGDSRPDMAVTNSGTTVSILQNICSIVPLPVELTSFTGEVKGSAVTLQWTTASEINNDYFSVERGNSGFSFGEIGQVKGAGNTSESTVYLFVDENAFPGINYYRLRQTDYNGDFNYSGVVAVHFRDEEHYYIRFNHESESIMVTRSGEVTRPTYIGLFDMSGQLFFRGIMESNEQVINTKQLARGIYFLKIYSDLHSEVSKVFIY